MTFFSLPELEYHNYLRQNGVGYVFTFVRLLLAKIYNFWQVCSFVSLLLAKIYNFGKYVRLLLAKISKKFASMFVCRFVCLLVCQFCQA